jgi:hypothetical protein
MPPRHPSARVLCAASAVLICALFAASPAIAQGGSASPVSPLTPLTPSPSFQTTPTTSAPTQTTSSSGGLSGTDAVLIGIGALIVLGGISLFIWYDARRRAPVRQRTAEAIAGGPGGSRPRPKPRKLSPAERRRRKRGKAR